MYDEERLVVYGMHVCQQRSKFVVVQNLWNRSIRQTAESLVLIIATTNSCKQAVNTFWILGSLCSKKQPNSTTANKQESTVCIIASF